MNEMKSHKLVGIASTREVFLDGVKLNPAKSQKLFNHSSDDFNWGYGGSGPAQLALAVLLELTDEESAIAIYQRFKWSVISTLTQGKDFNVKFKI